MSGQRGMFGHPTAYFFIYLFNHLDSCACNSLTNKSFFCLRAVSGYHMRFESIMFMALGLINIHLIILPG